MFARTLLLLMVLLPATSCAEDLYSSAASTEDNIRNMDRDHDGMVSIHEIRAYLEAQNGKGYRRELLDEMEMKADARSCASPFSRSFY
ncbi:hypothetical protein A7976_10165 [Methylobacillus sp. MM3]|jgi:Ca2+-binding EF-hand superfamily protein|uniref:hypothetical protein n=1 Tax=Methylobacillus sp. MM3 TaxID=1848039 RepID=UPI0007DEB5F0|nr:hypothetical protein [Methylobacillus sp. MM3]OAJ71816.1 hypothetical protein A7976_10165 [Methylobacillus sp. MM3]